MGKHLHTSWACSQGEAAAPLAAGPLRPRDGIARGRDQTGSIDVDCGAGGGSNMLAPLTQWQRVPLSPGARLGPYEIVAPLGSGGMGVVYRAHDLRLDRIVAIKVVGPSPDAAHRRQRFQREMRAIATLNHPHICSLYDVGLQEDVEFFVMEYLEGETLANRLLKGPLPMADTLRHAAALADAVALAHRHGIVHRDIKPGNIMLTASGVKLLDFGLAKVSAKAVVAGLGDEPTQSTDLTGAHTILGTLRYMAPEQLEGRDADARTDIFALGVVLYEMATGQRAFSHHSDAGMISAILTQDPVPMVDRQPQTPPNFQFAVEVCLAKNPDDRWQSAHDLARALTWIRESGSGTKPTPGLRWWQRRRRWLAAAVIALVIVAGVLAAPYLVGSAESRSLVVLPCTVIGASESDQAFCDGLNEAIAGKLAPLTLANALQTTTARDARARGITTAVDARRQFGATLVLQGTLLREGDKVRVNYDLVDATALRQLQSYTLSAASSDPFAIQDHVVEWAAGALALKLTDVERRTLIDHDTRNAGRARAVPAGIRLSDRLARAGQCRPRHRALHAGAGNRSAIRAGLRRARPCLLAESTRSDNDPQWPSKAREACRTGARNRPAPLGRACVPGNGIERLGSIRRGEGGIQEGARVRRAQRRRAVGAGICRRTPGRLQRGRTDVPDVQWNAGRTTGPAARGSRTSIGNRAATKRPPSSSSKPSS